MEDVTAESTTAAGSATSSSIIVNEVLCFIQNKMDNMAHHIYM